jgi:hypothetical protein
VQDSANKIRMSRAAHAPRCAQQLIVICSMDVCAHHAITCANRRTTEANLSRWHQECQAGQPKRGGNLQDPYSHPLYSIPAKTHRLLLRVTRVPSSAGASAPPLVSVETLRRLPTSHFFRGLADFQVASASVPMLDRTQPSVTPANHPAVAEPNRVEQPLLVLPPLFSLSDAPFKYGYKGFARKDMRTSIAWAPAAQKVLIGWEDATPSVLPYDDSAVAQVRPNMSCSRRRGLHFPGLCPEHGSNADYAAKG